MLNSYKPDIRVEKETNSISKIKDNDITYIIALHERELKEKEILGSNRILFRIQLKSRNLPKIFLTQLIKYIELIHKVNIIVNRHQLHLVHCHDLDALPLGVLLKAKFKSILVYDTHELQRERKELSRYKKSLVYLFERFFIKYADHVIVVSDSIKRWYQEKYGKTQINVIKNIPVLTHGNCQKYDIREMYDIPYNSILFIYCGNFHKKRGVELLLEVFKLLNHKYQILFIGDGVLKNTIRNFCDKYDNIHFHKKVNHNKLLEIISQADIGCSIKENVCLNTNYSLPNKFFEYLLSGIPVIISNLKDMSDIVMKYKCGWICEANERSIYEQIKSINRNDIMEKKNNIDALKKVYSWENEERKLIDIYNKYVR